MSVADGHPQAADGPGQPEPGGGEPAARGPRPAYVPQQASLPPLEQAQHDPAYGGGAYGDGTAYQGEAAPELARRQPAPGGPGQPSGFGPPSLPQPNRFAAAQFGPAPLDAGAAEAGQFGPGPFPTGPGGLGQPGAGQAGPGQPQGQPLPGRQAPGPQAWQGQALHDARARGAGDPAAGPGHAATPGEGPQPPPPAGVPQHTGFTSVHDLPAPGVLPPAGPPPGAPAPEPRAESRWFGTAAQPGDPQGAQLPPGLDSARSSGLMWADDMADGDDLSSFHGFAPGGPDLQPPPLQPESGPVNGFAVGGLHARATAQAVHGAPDRPDGAGPSAQHHPGDPAAPGEPGPPPRPGPGFPPGPRREQAPAPGGGAAHQAVVPQQPGAPQQGGLPPQPFPQGAGSWTTGPQPLGAGHDAAAVENRPPTAGDAAQPARATPAATPPGAMEETSVALPTVGTVWSSNGIHRTPAGADGPSAEVPAPPQPQGTGTAAPAETVPPRQDGRFPAAPQPGGGQPSGGQHPGAAPAGLPQPGPGTPQEPAPSAQPPAGGEPSEGFEPRPRTVRPLGVPPGLRSVGAGTPPLGDDAEPDRFAGAGWSPVVHHGGRAAGVPATGPHAGPRQAFGQPPPGRATPAPPPADPPYAEGAGADDAAPAAMPPTRRTTVAAPSPSAPGTPGLPAAPQQWPPQARPAPDRPPGTGAPVPPTEMPQLPGVERAALPVGLSALQPAGPDSPASPISLAEAAARARQEADEQRRADVTRDRTFFEAPSATPPPPQPSRPVSPQPAVGQASAGLSPAAQPGAAQAPAAAVPPPTAPGAVDAGAPGGLGRRGREPALGSPPPGGPSRGAAERPPAAGRPPVPPSGVPVLGALPPMPAAAAPARPADETSAPVAQAAPPGGAAAAAPAQAAPPAPPLVAPTAPPGTPRARHSAAGRPEPAAPSPAAAVGMVRSVPAKRAVPAPAAPGQAGDDPAAKPAAAPAAPFDEAGRAAVHRVISARRDVRNGFLGMPIPDDVLLRVLDAGHHAPSVGFSQPWDFIVIRSEETRARVHELVAKQRAEYAESLPRGRAEAFRGIRVEAILDTPVNVVVTCDATRGGRHTLGRRDQPQTAPYSACLAVENLWLAARAEGLGVGWVSFFDERELASLLGLPDHLEIVAYLCMGYVEKFPEEPELLQSGWARRRPLAWAVHEEEYGRRALPGHAAADLLQEALDTIRPLDAPAHAAAADRFERMTKPRGSLGVLETVAAQLSGLADAFPPPVPQPAVVAVFAADHGVHAQGVTPWPQEVTGQMVANFLAGGGVVNAFAAQVGAEVCVVDVGVATELGAAPGLVPRKIRPGTADFTVEAAMTREEAVRAVEVGIEVARELVVAGNRCLITGDMGVANTTASAALIAAFTGADAAAVTGRGTGVDDATHARKLQVVQSALAKHAPDASDPVGVLAAVGGLEHAALTGFVLGAAAMRVPVILDGVIAGAAALAAVALAPEAVGACVAGHRSTEPGHAVALERLNLRPLVDLEMRLGEGTGAVLALPLVQAAVRTLHDVATFDSAGVTEKG